jgi:hypothetical protein
VLDVQEGAQGGPQGRGELGAAIRCDDSGHFKTAHPSLKQSRGSVKGSHTGKRNDLWPPGGPVDKREKMGLPLRRGQQPRQVHLDVAESLCGDGNELSGYLVSCGAPEPAGRGSVRRPCP